MAKTPSDSLLAKDAIGQALSISSKKAKEDRAQLINDYNMAIAEIYNILGLIDSGVYIKTLPEVSASMNKFPKAGIISLSTISKWDKILELEILQSSGGSGSYLPVDNGIEVDYSIISNNRGFRGAIDPYDESIIYAIVENSIYFLVGENLLYTYSNVKFNIVYRRQPTILLLSQYDYEKIDVPDKYWSLLVNRIASIIEYRNGVFDKALTMVKVSYEQLLGSVDPLLKASIMKSLQAPTEVMQ